MGDVDERRAGRQLELIGEALGAAGRTGAELWLRGGWAMDFTLGRVTRDHGDIDWFTWAEGAEALARELIRLGYTEVAGPPAELQRDFAKDGLESSFTLIDRDHLGRIVVAGGPWAGTPWPQDLLDGGPGGLGGLSCPVVAPRAQIEIKRMMPVWDPSLPRREKDQVDIALLERHSGS
ncbi:aminoglycoside adenylyltransferase [Streptomyces sp. 604F]|uniref:nucleotidyltransferase domain-containing protein n=1 Tax=Streptomyces sp. 604F TaxID=1476754 RepID=UPI001397B563|nr:aminoglycoside adenylyltransferase [Streptomyces sp. 604F]MBP3076535.1 aminoglycoside adenylyltransferase [Streptomyces sp. 604F]QHV88232.1 aminoglycoside adenylyltransferase [Streptomyces sp. 604F]